MFTPSVPVLCYHDICDTGGHSVARFCEHLDAIIEAGFRTITAAELLGVITGKRVPIDKAVLLTFDDGHISNFLHVAPELEQRNMTGVFFALTDFIESGVARNAQTLPTFKPLPDCFREALTSQNYSQFINEGEIQALLTAGHEVYAHGCRHQATFRTMDPRYLMGHPKAHWSAWSIYPEFHKNFPTFSEASAYVYDGFWPTGKTNAQGYPLFRCRSKEERRKFCSQDFSKSYEKIRSLNNAKQQLFCWPWGHFDALSQEELKRAGFSAAFILERSANSPGTDPMRLNRLGVGKQKDGQWIQRRLAMYQRKTTANICFKKFRKKPEIKHILYATDSVKLSGGSRQLVNNVTAMLDLGLEVTVCVPSEATIPSALPQSAQVVFYDHFKRVLASAFFIKKLVRERKIDVVHTFHNKAYKACITAKIMGSKFRLFINRGVIFNPNTLFGLWARIADSMIVNSFACARSLRKVLVPMSRIQVVYNSFIPDGPPPPDRAKKRKRGIRIIYVGNEAKAKGLDVFLRMCQTLLDTELDAGLNTGQLKDVEFVVAGVGKFQKFKDNISPQLRDRLLDLGLLTHTQVQEELHHADILVLSSRMESLPNILPEAFSASLPVVCTAAGGVPELVAPGVGGFICPLEDHNCLAQKVRELITNFQLRINMGKANLQTVNELLGNQRKGLNLLRVYHGNRVASPLPLADMASRADMEDR